MASKFAGLEGVVSFFFLSGNLFCIAYLCCKIAHRLRFLARMQAYTALFRLLIYYAPLPLPLPPCPRAGYTIARSLTSPRCSKRLTTHARRDLFLRRRRMGRPLPSPNPKS